MAENGLILTRVLQGSRKLVWKLWTDADHLARWWGPAGFGMKVATLDFRVGGLFHYAMTPPDSDRAMWGRFVYDEVTPEESLVFRSAFSDEAGGVSMNPFNPLWPLEVRNVLTLEDQGSQTLLTIRGEPWQASPEQIQSFLDHLANVTQGFAGTFARLEAHLAEELEADRTQVYRRRFDAPRDAVWSAWTTPSKIAAWWGPSGFGNTIEAMDVRPGGQWLFTMHGPDGTDYPNRVTYLEVQEPSRLVYDHGDQGQPDQFRVTVTFTEAGRQTDLTYRMVFPTAADLRQVVEKFGASEGLKQNMDRFALWLTRPGLVVARVLPAPRSLVWKAFTDPTVVQKWWGPGPFTCPVARVDLRVGGRYLLAMRGPDGDEYWNTGVYREIIVDQKLVYADHFADAQGNVVSAASLGLPGEWPSELLVTVTFADLGPGKTLLTVHQQHLPAEWREMTLAGWSTSLDKLQRVLG